MPEGQEAFVEDNSDFFRNPLPGRDAPLGSPGGATAIGRVGIDTELVSSFEVP